MPGECLCKENLPPYSKINMLLFCMKTKKLTANIIEIIMRNNEKYKKIMRKKTRCFCKKTYCVFV